MCDFFIVDFIGEFQNLKILFSNNFSYWNIEIRYFVHICENVKMWKHGNTVMICKLWLTRDISSPSKPWVVNIFHFGISAGYYWRWATILNERFMKVIFGWLDLTINLYSEIRACLKLPPQWCVRMNPVKMSHWRQHYKWRQWNNRTNMTKRAQCWKYR